MRIGTLVALTVFLGFSGTASAFDCPNRFASAQSSIDKAKHAAMGMSNADQMKQVHMLLDDAKMLLHGAKHNHEKPQNKLDHARAMAKAGSAKAYADAAAVLATK